MEQRMRAAVARSGGVVTAATLRELGISGRVVAGWVRAGVLIPVRRGAYTTADLWRSWDEFRGRPLARIRAAEGTLQVPHVFSHDSAALLHRIPLLHPHQSPVHITRLDMRGTRTQYGIHHHGAKYGDDRVEEIDGLAVLDIPRTVTDVIREHGYRAGLVAADGAMQLGVSRASLRAAAAEVSGWPHSLTVGAVVADADPGAESVLETLARELVVEAGFDDIETQFPVRIATGVVWIDLRIGCHLVEADGHIKLRSIEAGGVADDPAESLWEERKRQHLVCAEGLGMTRLTYADHWGQARERAKQRLLAEYAVTERRFGTELPPHLEAFASQFRGRRYKTAG